MLPATNALFAAFQAPAMLWGLAGASVPILIHLFFRSRYRVVPWGAMKFLLTSVEQTSRRLKFQELILLITRCVLIALVALALARPGTPIAGTEDPDGPVDAVFLIDTSFSMGARTGAEDRLDFLKKRAHALLKVMPDGSSVQIITCSDRALVPDAPFALPEKAEDARRFLDGIRLTSHSSDLWPGVKAAVAALEKGGTSNKKLFIFSDMHRQAWEKQPGSIAQALKAVKDEVGIYLVHAPKQRVRNAAITGIASQTPTPRIGERTAFSVLLKNTGTEELKDLRLGLFVDAVEGDIDRFQKGVKTDKAPERLETTLVDRLSPGEVRLVTLSGVLDKVGLHVLTACVRGDDVPGDNRFDLVLEVPQQVQVLVVDGGMDPREPEKNSSFHLMHAMLPIKEGDRPQHYLTPKLVPPRLASPADLERSALCILVNCPMPQQDVRDKEDLPGSFVEALGPFVRQGKGLVIFAGDKVKPADYNRVLGTRLGLLPYPIKGVADRGKDPVNLSRQSAALAAYMPFAKDELFRSLDAVAVWKYLDLELPADKKEPDSKKTEVKKEAKEDAKKASASFATVALRYENDAPAVAVKRVGTGEVLLITTSADQGVKKGTGEPAWNLFSKTLGRVYVPFVQATLAHLLQQQTQAQNLIAGEALTWVPKEKDAVSFTLISPAGKETPLGSPVRTKHGLELIIHDFPVVGLYRLRAERLDEKGKKVKDDDAGTPLGVSADLLESDQLESLDKEQLNRLLEFAPIHWEGAGVINTESVLQGFDLTPMKWLLVAALCLAFFEVGLAYWCSRSW